MAIRTINAKWGGVGGWRAVVYEEYINLKWSGLGGWFAALPREVDFGLKASWAGGSGGFIIFTGKITIAPQAYVGVGGWTAGQPVSFDVAYGNWLGAGGGLVNPFQPRTQVAWRAGYNLLILDGTSHTVFSASLQMNVPATVLFNVGVPIPNDYTQFTLTITRPDGSSYQPNYDYYQIGEQNFIALGLVPTSYFPAGTYLAYSFTANELNQPGPWTMTYAAAFYKISMTFQLSPLNMARAA